MALIISLFVLEHQLTPESGFYSSGTGLKILSSPAKIEFYWNADCEGSKNNINCGRMGDYCCAI